MKNGYIDTYYSRNLPDYPARAALTEHIETDVCVIGGGLAGINTALGLLERGKNVAVVEAKRIGWGASGRNGGFVAKGYSASEIALLEKYGTAKAQALVAMTKDARQLIRKRIGDFSIDCGPVKNGVLTVSWRDEAQKQQDYIRRVNDTFDLGFEFWSRDRVQEHVKSPRYYAGVFSPHDFQFMPLNYLHGLAQAVLRKGGEIFENSAATKIEKSGAAWVVHTAQGSVRAKDIVLCCSIYIDGLDKRLQNAAFPVRTFVMATKPVDPNVLDTAIKTPHAIYDNRFCSDYYRLVPGNRVMWGGRVALWAKPDHIARLLLADMHKVYPQLRGHVEPDVAWAGDVCYAPHKMPQIGMIEDGYWYNTGFGGHGLCPTTVGGETVAAAIAANDDGYKKFEPFGLSYAGGRQGRYVAQMVYWWWRLRDYINV